MRRPPAISGWTLLGAVLVAAGALLSAPGLILLGGLTLLSRWLTTLWSRYGLTRLAFDRRLASERAVWGDEVALDVEIWNAKPLPLPWLLVDDYVTDSLRVRGRRLAASERPGRGSLQNSWSLLWYERVVRHLRIDARRRGAFTFGPVRLTVSDLFERGTNSEERELPATLVVRPRTVPVRSDEPARAPLGTVRTRTSLYADPARFAGIRPYRPGDPVRRLHWRATARVGEPVMKRFEPVHERSVLLAVDVQTVEGPHWLMQYNDDLLESLCVAAASLARRLLAGGSACGLLIGAQLVGGRRWSYLPPASARAQLGVIEDTLARLEPIVTLPYQRLLAVVPRQLPPGASLLTLSGRDPTPYLGELRRLAAIGYRCEHIAVGPVAADHVERARAAGVEARRGELEPDWRRADALVVAH